MFNKLDPHIQRRVVTEMYERAVAAGEILIKEGDTGVAASELYVVKEGKFEVGGAAADECLARSALLPILFLQRCLIPSTACGGIVSGAKGVMKRCITGPGKDASLPIVHNVSRHTGQWGKACDVTAIRNMRHVICIGSSVHVDRGMRHVQRVPKG